MDEADLIVYNAKVTTLQGNGTEAQAFAVRGESFIAVGGEAEVLRLRDNQTKVIDAGGRRVIPGLNDSHLHAIRGALRYNLELRWDGIESLQRGLQMIRDQAERTPAGQWVRVIGGWSPYQFQEKRMPTPEELNNASRETPVFVLFANSQVLLNRAGVKALKMSPKNEPVEGGHYKFVDGGGAIIRGTAAVHAMISMLPTFVDEGDKLNSLQHFFRELNRFGITSAVDAGASGVAYPEDYEALEALAARPKFPLRISYFLSAEKAGTEVNAFSKWTAEEKVAVNEAVSRLNGYVLEGAGEILVWDASDHENFMAPRPEVSEQALRDLTTVAKVIATHQWPIRIHGTYDETISRILDVFELVFEEKSYRARWAIDHAETITLPNIARIKAMGGGIMIQDRLAFAGEYFLERYGEQAALATAPLREIMDAHIPVGAGTDATRLSSYNPWVSLYWMVTGKTVGGTQIASPTNRPSREEALRLYTLGSAWCSGEEEVKGRIAPGQCADFAILSADYFSVPEDHIARIESVLTVTGGDVVYSAPPFVAFPPEQLPPARPEWSPVAAFGGYQPSH